MDDHYLLRQEDLVENPTARVPICLVLDVSASMDGQPIRELNDGVRLFFDAIRADDVAQYAAEICIVTFGDTVTKKLDFMSVDRQEVPRRDDDTRRDRHVRQDRGRATRLRLHDLDHAHAASLVPRHPVERRSHGSPAALGGSSGRATCRQGIRGERHHEGGRGKQSPGMGVVMSPQRPY